MTEDERVAIIKIELDAGHPVTTAYNVDDLIAAQEMNLANVEVNTTTTGLAAAAVTDASEFNALSTADQQAWLTLCGWDIVDFNNGIAVATAQGMWAGVPGTITRPLLLALRTKFVGQSTAIGVGNVKIGDIQNARAL